MLSAVSPYLRSVVLSSVVELVQPVVVLYPLVVELRSAAVVVISAATPFLDGHERGRPQRVNGAPVGQHR